MGFTKTSKRLLRGAPFFKWLKKGSPLACRLSIFAKPEFSWLRETLVCDAAKKGFDAKLEIALRSELGEWPFRLGAQ